MGSGWQKTFLLQVSHQGDAFAPGGCPACLEMFRQSQPGGGGGTGVWWAGARLPLNIPCGAPVGNARLRNVLRPPYCPWEDLGSGCACLLGLPHVCSSQAHMVTLSLVAPSRLPVGIHRPTLPLLMYWLQLATLCPSSPRSYNPTFEPHGAPLLCLDPSGNRPLWALSSGPPVQSRGVALALPRAGWWGTHC